MSLYIQVLHKNCIVEIRRDTSNFISKIDSKLITMGHQVFISSTQSAKLKQALHHLERISWQRLAFVITHSATE